jgi:hypothetical protein
VTIAGNHIDTWYRGAGISIGDADGIVVHGNTIEGPLIGEYGGRPGQKRQRKQRKQPAAVVVSDARMVTVQANVLRGGWTSLAAAIQVDAKSTTAVHVAGNEPHPALPDGPA